MYKEGEPLRELSKFLADGEGHQLVEVRIPAESMSNANRQVRTPPPCPCPLLWVLQACIPTNEHFSVLKTSQRSMPRET